MALTLNGDVYGWGQDDSGQLGEAADSSAFAPLPIPLLLGGNIVGIACGPSQSLIWKQGGAHDIPLRAPFVVETTEEAFRILNQLLSVVSEGVCRHDWPPPQDKESMTVACLNLLRLQVRFVSFFRNFMEIFGQA